jgi:hypothetical protein
MPSCKGTLNQPERIENPRLSGARGGRRRRSGDAGFLPGIRGKSAHQEKFFWNHPPLKDSVAFQPACFKTLQKKNLSKALAEILIPAA